LIKKKKKEDDDIMQQCKGTENKRIVWSKLQAKDAMRRGRVAFVTHLRLEIILRTSEREAGFKIHTSLPSLPVAH